MKLIDLKLPKEKTKSDICCASPSERDAYPYGMQVRFETEQVKKDESLKTLKVGDKVNVVGLGIVTGVNTSERQQGEPRYSIEIQLHQIGCEAEKAPEKMTMKEYKEFRSKKGQ